MKPTREVHVPSIHSAAARMQRLRSCEFRSRKSFRALPKNIGKQNDEREIPMSVLQLSNSGAKFVTSTEVEMSEVVNSSMLSSFHGYLGAGQLMRWMDICGI